MCPRELEDWGGAVLVMMNISKCKGQLQTRCFSCKADGDGKAIDGGGTLLHICLPRCENLGRDCHVLLLEEQNE